MVEINSLLKSRLDPSVDEPIRIFARGHMTLTVSLLSRWPDVPIGDRKTQVHTWFRQFSSHLEPVIKKWYDGHSDSELVAKFVTTSIEAAIAHIIGDASRTRAPEAEIYVRKLMARGNQIIKVLGEEQPELANALPRLTAARMPVWGQHGAHFPNIQI